MSTKTLTAKEKIIIEAIKLFQVSGYHNTSTAQIANSAGILKGSLYHHFDSKEALMSATLEFLLSYYTTNVFSIAYKEKLSGTEKLQELAKISEKILIQDHGGCLMGSIALETAQVKPAFAEIIKKFFQSWIDSLAHIFAKKLPKEKAIEKAESFIAEIEGSVIFYQVFKNPEYIKRTHRKILEYYLNN